MKKITLAALASVLVLSGAAVAQQSGEQKKSSRMGGAMQEMMMGNRGGENGMGGMEGMMGMMKMMGQTDKMMNQCASMMGSMQSGSEPPKQDQSE